MVVVINIIVVARENLWVFVQYSVVSSHYFRFDMTMNGRSHTSFICQSICAKQMSKWSVERSSVGFIISCVRTQTHDAHRAAHKFLCVSFILFFCLSKFSFHHPPELVDIVCFFLYPFYFEWKRACMTLRFVSSSSARSVWWAYTATTFNSKHQKRGDRTYDRKVEARKNHKNHAITECKSVLIWRWYKETCCPVLHTKRLATKVTRNVAKTQWKKNRM